MKISNEKQQLRQKINEIIHKIESNEDLKENFDKLYEICKSLKNITINSPGKQDLEKLFKSDYNRLKADHNEENLNWFKKSYAFLLAEI